MPYLFTSESVSEGHPDKVADQISDALLDEFLKQDPQSKVACETLVTTGLVVLSGEVKTEAYVDVQKVAREVIKRIGYTKSEYKFDAEACGVISAIHEQSADINQGVERSNPEEQGAGDQGMMFGYASSETDNYMPLALSISHLLLEELSAIRKEGKEMTYLRPDAKSQVTIRYSDNDVPEKIDTIVISTQHDEFVLAESDSAAAKDEAEQQMVAKIKEDVDTILIPRVLKLLPERIQKLFNSDIVYHINPTGKFVIGGPHGDTGLTGRKIIVDTYGGKGAHGGGAFSGKDSSKVDRSAAYATRHIAKNLVAAGVADQALVQVAYAIGVANPVGLYVTTYGSTKVKDANGNLMSDGEIAEKVNKLFDMRPYAIVQRFGLQNPIFGETAAYGHMGRKPGTKTVEISKNGQKETKEFETFTWEKLDYVDKIKAEFGL
ncbi:methionine adenosyltransferase [Pontibacter rugosus]|uniref:S-adenosylmethionine synthase n=1 Tax=Pontibacter rugosus TaxID=1745966 RepID=A0ABW3STC0_9BACT